MDQTFDCLNSKRFRADKPFNSALHFKNPGVEKALLQAVPYYTELVKVSLNGKISRPPCFDGIIQTINGILLYYQQEKRENADIYILTSKLNQDVLENFFASVRQKGGYNLNPTSRIFRTSFRSYTISNLIKPIGGSYEADKDEYLALDETENVPPSPSAEGQFVTSKPSTSFQCPDENQMIFDENLDLASEESPKSSSSSETETLEKCATKYFAGYLAHKTINKFSCENCKNLLLSKNIFYSDKNEILLFHKLFSHVTKTHSFEGLKAPSPEFFKITKFALNIFPNTFSKNCHLNNIGSIIVEKIMKKINKYDFIKDFCKDHLLFLIKLLVRTKIFSETKELSKNKQQSKQTKLKIIQHV